MPLLALLTIGLSAWCGFAALKKDALIHERFGMAAIAILFLIWGLMNVRPPI